MRTPDISKLQCSSCVLTEMNKAEIMAFAKRCRDYAGVDTMIDPMNTVQKMHVAQLADLSREQRIRILEERVSMLEKNPVWKNSEKRKQESIDEIARRVLDIDSLETRNSIELDTYEMHILWIKQALQEAFDAGLIHRILPEDD